MPQPVNLAKDERLNSNSLLTRLKLFLGLSRTPHAILDVATPAMAALLYLGHFPPVPTILLGLLTAFAGYTAVYALNDIVDVNVDRQRLSVVEHEQGLFDVDEIFVRHPVAQGLLSYRQALSWFMFWSAVAIVGAWLLNPYCGLLFLVSASLEAVYCKLLKITHLKIIPSALVKASGGVAGILAVDPAPSLGFLFVLALWLAAWEVGGQNIANDIVDMDNDSKVCARTTLTVKGLHESIFYLVVANGMAFFGSLAIFALAGNGVGWLYPLLAGVVSWFLILEPTKSLYFNPGNQAAARLFNRASYIPVALLSITVLSCAFPL